MRPKRVDRTAFVLAAAANRRVLHVGCVDSGLLGDRLTTHDLLHQKLSAVAADLWGLDADRDGIERLQGIGFRNVHYGSAEQPPDGIPRRYFDVILAGEVIEHLRNPGLFLDSAASLVVEGGQIVITTPNALRFYNSVPALIGRELIHPDHVSWYSPHTLRRTLELSPFDVSALYVYNQPPVLKVPKQGRPMARATRRAINIAGPVVHGATVRLFPYLSDGLVAVATLKSSPPANERSA